jgi:ferredoxin
MEEFEMKVKIDNDLCTGCEECVDAVPDVFEMKDDGEVAAVKVDTVPGDLEDAVQEAADDCPAEAIVIE